MTPERAALAILIVSALVGGSCVALDFWRSKRAAERRVDAIVDGTAGERPITVRRPDGALVTTTLDAHDPDSISRFLDTVRVPAPRDRKEGE